MCGVQTAQYVYNCNRYEAANYFIAWKAKFFTSFRFIHTYLRSFRFTVSSKKIFLPFTSESLWNEKKQRTKKVQTRRHLDNVLRYSFRIIYRCYCHHCYVPFSLYVHPCNREQYRLDFEFRKVCGIDYTGMVK